MSSYFKNFLKNVGKSIGNPKGNLADFQHASKLYVKSNYRLAPRQKFLYHVIFNIHPNVLAKSSFLKKNQTALNMIVKSTDLPKFKIQTDAVHQYNRKKQVHTKLEYDPVNIVLHDDNLGLSTNLWATYYGYHFADSSHGFSSGSIPNVGSSQLGGGFMGGILGAGINLVKKFLGKSTTANSTGSTSPSVPAAYLRNTYQGEEFNKYRFGLDNNSDAPFFTTIQIFQMSRKTFQCFTLINPKIISWQHDNLNNEDGATPTANTMTVIYEAVVYGVGKVKSGNPATFGVEYYDRTPSPLSLAGGGGGGLFGTLSGAGEILGDLSSAETFSNPFKLFGTLKKGVNLIKNAKKLTKEGIRQELFGAVKGAFGFSGVGDNEFAKKNGRGQKQTTNALAPKELGNVNSLTGEQQALIRNTPGAVDSLVRLSTKAGVAPAGPAATSLVLSLLASGRNGKVNALAQKVYTGIKG
jgi:hypothetical protein